MANNKLTAASKFLSYVLRHRPESIELVLDREGWANIDDLVSNASHKGRALSRSLIDQVVASNDKKRFSISPDGTRIRAAQGHSSDSVDIAYQPVQPPPVLYHGTAQRFIESIKHKGLVPGSRHYVHLSDTQETAFAVGRRHGKPVVLQVAAREMHKDRFQFFCSENGVWLTASVPAQFIRFSDS